MPHLTHAFTEQLKLDCLLHACKRVATEHTGMLARILNNCTCELFGPAIPWISREDAFLLSHVQRHRDFACVQHVSVKQARAVPLQLCSVYSIENVDEPAKCC